MIHARNTEKEEARESLRTTIISILITLGIVGMISLFLDVNLQELLLFLFHGLTAALTGVYSIDFWNKNRTLSVLCFFVFIANVAFLAVYIVMMR